MTLRPIDHEGIRATLTAYSHAIDFGRFEDLAALFLPEGSFEMPGLPSDSPLAGLISGRDGLLNLGATVWAGAKGNFRHWVQPPLIAEIADGHVSATSYAMLVRTGATPYAGILVTGIYRDELRRMGEQWLIAKREFHSDPQAGHGEYGGDPLISMHDGFVSAATSDPSGKSGN